MSRKSRRGAAVLALAVLSCIPWSPSPAAVATAPLAAQEPADSAAAGDDDSYLSPEFTPDGDYVVANEGSKLWICHIQGGGGAQLIEVYQLARLRELATAEEPWLAYPVQQRWIVRPCTPTRRARS